MAKVESVLSIDSIIIFRQMIRHYIRLNMNLFVYLSLATVVSVASFLVRQFPPLMDNGSS